MKHKQQITAIFIVLWLSPANGAAILKPETKAAWDSYLSAATAAMQARLRPGAQFLWLDEQPDRAEEVRINGPRVQPLSSQKPKKVPSGLIHD